MNKILIVDDQQDIRLSVAFFLNNHGYQCLEAQNPQQAFEMLQQNAVALILLDMNFTSDTTSGKEGLAFLQRLNDAGLSTPVVVMTAWANIDLAVNAMQLGAADFIEKPWQNKQLLQKIEASFGKAKSPHKGAATQSEPVANAEAMKQTLAIAKRAARSQANILITGENGTGKSMLAHFIHRHSARADQALISVNMGSIPESLFESELFGHKKGAFTDAVEDRKGRFELASSGTLFLDEIGTLPFTLQAKLLRVLESGEYEAVGDSHSQTSHARVVSATNANLNTMIAKGEFRQDLLFRLNTIEINLPPLRQRQADIIPLAEYFLQQHGHTHNRANLQLSPCSLSILSAHSWPGNIRELSHCIERAVILAASSTILAADLGINPEQSHTPSLTETHTNQTQDKDVMSLDDAEKQVISNVLNHYQGNVQDAASHLKLSKSALYRKLSKLNIDVSKRAKVL